MGTAPNESIQASISFHVARPAAILRGTGGSLLLSNSILVRFIALLEVFDGCGQGTLSAPIASKAFLSFPCRPATREMPNGLGHSRSREIYAFEKKSVSLSVAHEYVLTLARSSTHAR